MMKSKFFLSACLTVVASCSAMAMAQNAHRSDYILVSDKYGDPGYVGLMPQYGARSIDDPMDTFRAQALSGADVAFLFQKLCLDRPFDAAAYSAAVATAAPDFRPTVRQLAEFSAPKPLIGSFHLAAASLSQNFSDYGISSLWLGEEAEKLNNRPYARFSGSLIITGPFETKNAYAPQCNVTLRTANIGSAKDLLDAVQAALPGYNNAKRVEKPKYGRGVWIGAPIGDRVPRVAVMADKLHKPENTVHLTVQLLPVGVVK